MTAVILTSNALSALPAGVFDGLDAVTVLNLNDNALGAGSIEDGVFEPLTGLSTRLSSLDLRRNPGSASFLPRADAGADLVLRAGETATLGGPGTGGGPWGTNVEYEWVEVDADDNPVADADRAEGLATADVARPGFTAPALAEERVLRYRLAVQGRGHRGIDVYTASDTVTVTVRAAPAVTAVAVTSVPHAGETYLRGETIEVSVTFSQPVTVSTVSGTPTIGLEVGTEVRRAAYARNAGPAVLVFGYTVAEEDRDEDGIAVPANGILLADGTIADAQGGAAALGHAAVAADAAHRVDGSDVVPMGGVCERTRRCATLWWRRRRRTTRTWRTAPAWTRRRSPGSRARCGWVAKASRRSSRGFRRAERSDSCNSDEQRAERAAGGGVRRAGRGDGPEPERQRARHGKH